MCRSACNSFFQGSIEVTQQLLIANLMSLLGSFKVNNETVDKVAGDAAAQQPEAHLHGPEAEAELAPPGEDRDQRRHGEQRQEGAPAAEQAPGRAGVADVHQVEKVVDHGDMPRRAVGGVGQARANPGLGGLVEHQHACGQRQQPAIGEDALQPRARRGGGGRRDGWRGHGARREGRHSSGSSSMSLPPSSLVVSAKMPARCTE